MTQQYDLGSTAITVPRGTPNLVGITLDMTQIYLAERRLVEVRTVSPATAPELVGFFNEACNETTKYLAWIEYEILQAKKYFGLAKATVVLEKAPAEFLKIKETGIKFNEDFREALVAKDAECQKTLDVLNSLEATKVFLEGKAESFKRAYYACEHISDAKKSTAASPNLSMGQSTTFTPDNFMGERRRG